MASNLGNAMMLSDGMMVLNTTMQSGFSSVVGGLSSISSGISSAMSAAKAAGEAKAKAMAVPVPVVQEKELPQLDVGGVIPRDMQVQAHQGEVFIPKAPSQQIIQQLQGSQVDTKRLEQLLENVIAVVQQGNRDNGKKEIVAAVKEVGQTIGPVTKVIKTEQRRKFLE